MGLEDLKVRCYSGRTYAKRPVSFLWQDREYEVAEIEKEWLEPGERHFRVCTTGNQLFHLRYVEQADQWYLVED
jgi:hypothetical protein